MGSILIGTPAPRRLADPARSPVSGPSTPGESQPAGHTHISPHEDEKLERSAWLLSLVDLTALYPQWRQELEGDAMSVSV